METVFTLEKIAYAIKNDLEAGLKGTANYNFSVYQLIDMVIAERNSIITQMKMNGTFSPHGLLQEVNCITLDCEDLGLCCTTDTMQPTLHFELPMIMEDSVMYVGNPDYKKNFKIYWDNASNYDKYKDTRLTNRPYIRFRQNAGKMHGFVFNAPTFNYKKISISAIFMNPTEVNFDCCTYNYQTDRFPAPDGMIGMIIDNIVRRYASNYYRFNGANKLNNGTSLA